MINYYRIIDKCIPIILLQIISQPQQTTSYAAYEIFQGFQSNITESVTNGSEYSLDNVTPKLEATTHTAPPTGTTRLAREQTKTVPNINNSIDHETTDLAFKSIPSNFNCPEEEKPTNIGAYEVPTQKDFVVLIRKRLAKTFETYHKKALFFLKDIKQATAASINLVNKCPVPELRFEYKQCVKKISSESETLTKSLVTSLESQRHDVVAFTNGTICNLAAMEADPVRLMKVLAMEEVSLEFALPSFLRLLNACREHCVISKVIRYESKAVILDQSIVMEHFLNKKNYYPIHPATIRRKETKTFKTTPNKILIN